MITDAMTRVQHALSGVGATVLAAPSEDTAPPFVAVGLPTFTWDAGTVTEATVTVTVVASHATDAAALTALDTLLAATVRALLANIPTGLVSIAEPATTELPAYLVRVSFVPI